MQNAISKPTVKTSDVAAMRAIGQWDNYQVTTAPNGWTVKNLKNGKEYHVTVDGHCDCPHFTGRLEGSGEVCKHFSRADLAERLGTVETAPALDDRDHWGTTSTEETWTRVPETGGWAPEVDTWRADRDRRILRDFGPEC